MIKDVQGMQEIKTAQSISLKEGAGKRKPRGTSHMLSVANFSLHPVSFSCLTRTLSPYSLFNALTR